MITLLWQQLQRRGLDVENVECALLSVFLGTNNSLFGLDVTYLNRLPLEGLHLFTEVLICLHEERGNQYLNEIRMQHTRGILTFEITNIAFVTINMCYVKRGKLDLPKDIQQHIKHPVKHENYNKNKKRKHRISQIKVLRFQSLNFIGNTVT